MAPGRAAVSSSAVALIAKPFAPNGLNYSCVSARISRILCVHFGRRMTAYQTL